MFPQCNTPTFNLISLNIFTYPLIVDFVLEPTNFSFELGNYILILSDVKWNVQDIFVHLTMTHLLVILASCLSLLSLLYWKCSWLCLRTPGCSCSPLCARPRGWCGRSSRCDSCHSGCPSAAWRKFIHLLNLKLIIYTQIYYVDFTCYWRTTKSASATKEFIIEHKNVLQKANRTL